MVYEEVWDNELFFFNCGNGKSIYWNKCHSQHALVQHPVNKNAF